MESFTGNAIPCLDSLNCDSLTLFPPINHESYTGNSHIRQTDLFELPTHSHPYTLSLKYLTNQLQADLRDSHRERAVTSFENERIDDSFSCLNLFRGISENYEYFEEESCHLQPPYSYIQLPSITHSMQFVEQGRQQTSSTQRSSELFLPISEQELKQQWKNNDFPYNSGGDEEEERLASQLGSKVTKNVTKNIGKLLFKFIWKHRKTLGQRLGIQRSHWQSFMKMISLCKKQNNITRQYLIRRWQGQGLHCALFRRLSRHFFRMHCLSAIMKSHIGLKRVHFERIHRFSAAVTDPEALASLA